MQSMFRIGQLVRLSEGAADREKGRTYCSSTSSQLGPSVCRPT